jgi:hypothetical protein
MPELVKSFRNSKLTLEPKGFKEDNFERSVESVKLGSSRMSAVATPDGQRIFHDLMLAGLTDKEVGIYSYYHD